MSNHAKPLPPVVRVGIVVAASLLAATAAILLVWGSLHRLRHPTPSPDITLSSSYAPVTTTTTTTSTTVTETQSTTTVTTTTTKATTQYIFKELTFSSPDKTKFTTTESTLAFMGSTDSKSKLTMNGKNVVLSAIGGFSLDVKLTPGINTFTFVSGKKTIKYTVTYQAEVLRSVTPTKAVTLEGGGSIQIQSVARKGAKVTAKFNGQTKTMTVTGQQEDAASDFTTYQATYKLPTATKVKQNLGRATITATYNGLSKTMNTATVTISPKTAAQFISVTADYAETFSGAVVNDYSRPTSAYLPAGTVDQVMGTGSAAGNTYYLLGCGRWIYSTDAKIVTDVKKLDNTPLKE